MTNACKLNSLNQVKCTNKIFGNQNSFAEIIKSVVKNVKFDSILFKKKSKIIDSSFSDIRFFKSSFKDCNISNSNFKKVGFLQANFEFVNILNSIFDNVIFYDKETKQSSILKNVEILNSKFTNCSFFQSSCTNVTFKNCELNNVCFNTSFLKNVIFKNVKFKNIKFSHLNLISCEFIDCEFENCEYEISKVKNIPENIKNQMKSYEHKKNKNSEEKSSVPQKFELNDEEFPSLDQPSQNNDNPKEDIDNVFYTERQSSEKENKELIQKNKEEEFDLFERLDKEINDRLEREFNSLMDENVNLIFIVSNTKHNSQSEIEFNEKTKNQIKNSILNIFEKYDINDINHKIYLLKKSLNIEIKEILEIFFLGTSFEFSSASEQNILNPRI